MRRSGRVVGRRSDSVQNNRLIGSQSGGRVDRVDGGGVERIHGLVQLHAEVFAGIEGSSLANQHLSQIGINAPVAVLAGMG